MSAFNLLHLVTKSQPVALRACGLPSGSCRDKKSCKVVFSQQELRKRLTPLQYHVTQEKGTESAFEGEYTHHKDPGIYKCVVCGTPLFKSETKFDSGSGWPSFHDVISSDAVTFTDDFSYGMHRVETSCSQGRTSQHLSTREQTCDLRSSTQAYPHETLVWEAATRVHRWRSERCTSMLQRLRLRPCFHISSIRMFLENTVSTSPQFTSSMGLTAIINEVLA
ncbi:methionine-R-sulfoxide reductase B3 isoform X2 [Camelus ferus]|uniref:Peptide-methionine (R)-S-oxide reductase n=2 Tax=Camelus TaxID=9836 RepID=A0A8B8U3R3_CAMFR|nr:methionine-R-sulfoxide reductase B3 isoform X1 [Camelus dromedarius]XP_031318645.1 methionine-R-sulfoxide reductase B3 isoform X1 [Camelus dromedarius]XP_032349231.1 methionine-R-sulfoxide reductase B3 isoform X2 [Camelus ferus]XP_032349232.1 methionine-R-sulfoxide reductase B3 isoform X2 [Camelus ferus]XP_045362970.1 methionine-R-sulfoxide reductase B3 isoform X1 [Camelus bactrianus]XP_045362971.1 methionine-R-sulfoxide reductase B3 isoform X1 [Camelus bactrianus]